MFQSSLIFNQSKIEYLTFEHMFIDESAENNNNNSYNSNKSISNERLKLNDTYQKKIVSLFKVKSGIAT